MLNISKNKCVGCGICESECPVKAISVDIRKGLAIIDKNRCIDCKLCIKKCPQNAIKEITKELLFAIGTDDEKRIKSDDHFGMSGFFQVWKYSNGELNFIEKRENSKYKEDEERIHGDPGKAKATASVLKDIDVLVGKMMGPNIGRLKNQFVCVIIRESIIEQGIKIIKENINEIIEEEDKKERMGIILK